MEPRRKLHPVTRLLEALKAENIRFMLIGMSAAIVQGVMETTMGANTVAYLKDGTPVNFVFDEVAGLGSFARELKHTERLRFRGKRIPVLKLERILKSKETIRRDKDLAHIVHIRNLLRCRRALATRSKGIRKNELKVSDA